MPYSRFSGFFFNGYNLLNAKKTKYLELIMKIQNKQIARNLLKKT